MEFEKQKKTIIFLQEIKNYEKMKKVIRKKKLWWYLFVLQKSADFVINIIVI